MNPTGSLVWLEKWSEKVGIVASPPLCHFPNELKHEIIKYLPVEALSRLGRCSSHWRQLTDRRLYAEDVRHGPSRAIGWAVARCALHDAGLANIVMDKSLKQGGDVNAFYKNRGTYATPLHYAAAYGKLDFVSKLIQHGALVNMWCSGMPWSRRLEIPGLAEAVTAHPFLGSYVNGFMWSPLVVPILKKDVVMVNCLIEAGVAPVVISSGSDGHFTGLAVSVYHMISVVKSPSFADNIRIWENTDFAAAIDTRLTNCGNTALNVAIREGNRNVVERLLDEGVDIHIPSAAHRTPLVSAINYMLDSFKPLPSRKATLHLIERLIRAGAVLNPPQPIILAPLEQVLRWLDLNDRPGSLRLGKTVVGLLLEGGADPNHRNIEGRTTVQWLCSFINESGGNSTLERMLLLLISYGGDVNAIPAINSRSVMANSICNFILDRNSPAHLRKILIESGARLLPREVPFMFRLWCLKSWFRRPKEYNILQDRNYIDQLDINAAWGFAIVSRNLSLFRALQEGDLQPTNGNDLVRHVLRTRVKEFWPAILNCPWDANSVSYDSRHESLLHLVVQLAHGDQPAFSPMMAARIAERLIESGTSTLLRDANGKLASDLLPEPKKHISKLHRCLLESMAEERIEVLERSELTDSAYTSTSTEESGGLDTALVGDN